MVISYTSSGDVSIKTKSETVTLGSSVTIGSFVVPGPGEYDIASIQCEAKALTNSFVSFIRTEDLTVTFLSELDGQVTKLDDASSTHILVADIRSDDKPDSLKPIIKGIEPSYVVICGSGATPEFAAALGIQPVEGGTLKLTRAGLPLEGTYLLNRA
ncbi:MAG TPA: hypothetical protein VLA04_00510 [Verrucomicrobiae bacterium]|nr:hypothetical protein [Verrucomicrobiae bacterium]